MKLKNNLVTYEQKEYLKVTYKNLLNLESVL